MSKGKLRGRIFPGFCNVSGVMVAPDGYAVELLIENVSGRARFFPHQARKFAAYINKCADQVEAEK